MLYDGGALGTPSSGTATNLSGTAAGLTAGAATALAANPAACGANLFVTDTAANGDLTCTAIADAAVPNTITIDLAATATALATPRTIAGVSFDGTANIAIPSTGLSDSGDLVRETTANTYGAFAQDMSLASLKVPSSITRPATCAVGEVYFDTDATSGQRFYGCETTNNWVLQGDGGGGGGITSLEGQTGATQTFTDDTNVTIVSGADAHVITWAGLLAGARGGTNNGFMDFTGPATSLKTFTLPNASATILTTNALVTGAQGGTNNGFTEFTGPATTLKTFTLPNASATILTDNADVTVAQGGTGVGTLTGLVVGAGTSNMTAITSSTVGQIPRVTGADTFAFGALDLADADAVTGILDDANGGTSNGFFTVSGPATTSKTFTFPNASATVLTDNALVTVAQGGTNLSAGTSGGILGYTGTGTLASSALLASGAVVIGGGAGATPTTSTGNYTVTKFTSGVPSAATVGTDYGTPDAITKTFTNTTIDAAATGNSLTLIDRKYFTAAGCNGSTATGAFDLPTSSAATATCIGTTTTTGFLVFADGSTQVATAHMRLPDDWVSTSFGIKLTYSGSVSSTSTMDWRVSTACVADDADPTSPSYNATSTNSAAGPTTTPQIKTSTFTPAVTNCAAGEMMYIKFEKVTGDTYTGSGYLQAAEVSYTITQ
jgi:hypothetical protein